MDKIEELDKECRSTSMVFVCFFFDDTATPEIYTE